jgi:hypothetical protein
VRITISAKSSVTDEDNKEVTDAAVLSRLDGLTDWEDIITDFASAHCMGELYADLRALLAPGTYLRFVYKPDRNELWCVTEYRSSRPLTKEELDRLADYTRIQWSDGIGENFRQLDSFEACGYYIAPGMGPEDFSAVVLEQNLS